MAVLARLKRDACNVQARGLGSAAGAGFGVGTRASAGASAGARAGARVAARVGASMRVRGPARSCDASRGVQLPKHDDEAEQVTDVTGDAKDVHEHDGWVARSRSRRCRSVRARVTRRRARWWRARGDEGVYAYGRPAARAVVIIIASCTLPDLSFGSSHGTEEARSWRNFSSDPDRRAAPATRRWPIRLEARRPLPHGSQP